MAPRDTLHLLNAEAIPEIPPQMSQLPDATTNMAQDPDILAQVRDVAAAVSQIRTARQPLHRLWERIDRMEDLVHDETRRYLGRHESYLPIATSLFQQRSATIRKGLFPSADEYFDVVDKGGNGEKAKAVKAYVKWELESNAKIRLQAEQMTTQMVKFGPTVWKRHYSRKVLYQVSPVMGVGGVPQLQYGPVSQEGFQVTTISLYNFYIWPTTARGIKDATIVFEDMEVPWSTLQYMLRKGILVNETAARSAPESAEYMAGKQIAHGEVTPPQQGSLIGNAFAQTKALTQVWTRLFLPSMRLLQWEDPDCQYPVRILLAGSDPLSVTRNPELLQEPPYDFFSPNAKPGFIYGYDTGKMAQALQANTNDAFNMWLDVAGLCLSPVTVGDINLLGGHPPPPLYPGLFIPTFGPPSQALEMFRPPYQMLDYGAQLVNGLRRMEEDLAQQPAQMQGSTSNQAKTATQAQILQKNMAIPMSVRVEDLEQAMLIPTMQAAWLAGIQYRDRNVMALAAGRPIQITPADLLIDAEMSWKASQMHINQAQRAQASMQMLDIAMKLAPVLAQQGVIVDPLVLLERIWYDQGYNNFDSFIRRATGSPADVMQMQANALAAGNQAAQQRGSKAGNRPRSAVEQGGGERGMPAASGEAEDFMEVRQGADALAAQYGNLGG